MRLLAFRKRLCREMRKGGEQMEFDYQMPGQAAAVKVAVHLS